MDARKLLRIARWEVTKNAGGVDGRTVAVMVLAVLAMGLVAGLAIGGSGPGLDAGMYRVGVDDSSRYYRPAVEDPTFVVREPSHDAIIAHTQELRFQRTSLRENASTTKGRAALDEFRNTIDDANERAMAEDDNRSAAYPVAVDLVYAEQTGVSAGFASSKNSGAHSGMDSQTTDPATGSGENGDESSARTNPTGGTGNPADDDRGTGDGDTGTGVAGQGGPAGSGGLGGELAGWRVTGGATSGTPADIQPPFPFESLLLAFLFLVPMNFVIQAYGSTMLSERLKRRGELLLVSPASRVDVIVGKTLPYLLAAIVVESVITLGLRLSGIAPGGSPIAVLALLPLAGLFLGATFCGAMFARSFKELTFVTVTITVALTSYAFVPAIFTEVTPIALISPLTIVVRDLQNKSVFLGNFVFSTVPPLVTALVLFGLGAGLYREEDMFTQRPIPAKVLDALSGRIRSSWSAMKLSILLLPFVFVAELVAVALLFALGEVSIPLVLVAVVFVEEVAKSLHLYAGFSNGRYERVRRTALVVGVLSGVGFFLAEKFLLVAQLVDLETIPTGRAALIGGIVPQGVPPVLVAVLFLFAPLVLHVVTASISSLGAHRGRRQYLGALVVAMGVHFVYNYTVVTTLV